MKQALLAVLLLTIAYSTLAGPCKQLTFATVGGKQQYYDLEPLANLYVSSANFEVSMYDLVSGESAQQKGVSNT